MKKAYRYIQVQVWWVRMYFHCMFSIFEGFLDKKEKLKWLINGGFINVTSEYLSFEYKIAPGTKYINWNDIYPLMLHFYLYFIEKPINEPVKTFHFKR